MDFYDKRIVDQIPAIGSRWARNVPFDPDKHGDYNAYTITCITYPRADGSGGNIVYTGDNGKVWDIPLESWPGNLVPETCPRLRLRMECLECDYPFSEAKLPLDERVPHKDNPKVPELPELRGMTIFEILEQYYGFKWAI